MKQVASSIIDSYNTSAMRPIDWAREGGAEVSLLGRPGNL